MQLLEQFVRNNNVIYDVSQVDPDELKILLRLEYITVCNWDYRAHLYLDPRGRGFMIKALEEILKDLNLTEDLLSEQMSIAVVDSVLRWLVSDPATILPLRALKCMYSNGLMDGQHHIDTQVVSVAVSAWHSLMDKWLLEQMDLFNFVEGK